MSIKKWNLSNIKITHKVWIGFILVITLSSVISLVALRSFNNVDKQVNMVVSKDLPTMISLMELKQHITKINASIGFYLVGKSNSEKKNIDLHFYEFEKILNKLKKNPVFTADKKTKAKLSEIEQYYLKYKSYHKPLLAYAASDVKNFPGFAYASANLNPFARKIQALLTGMTQAEASEEANLKRRSILMSISSTRLTWASLLIDLRVYLAARAPANLANIKTFKKVFITQLKKLSKFGDDLAFEQADAMERLGPLTKVYFKNLDTLFTIHSGKKWRMDSWTIRNKLEPIAENIRKSIDALVAKQRFKSSQSSEQLLAGISSSTSLIALLVVISIIGGLLIAWLLSRIISKPLYKTISFMNNIAEGDGDLTVRLEVNSNDEVGQLAEAFNKFVTKMHSLVNQISISGTQSDAAASTLSRTVTEVNTSTNKQNVELELVAAAINEMTMTVQEISNNSSTASEHAANANEQAAQGKRVVEDTIAAINTVAGDVDQASEAVATLEKDSNEINAVLDVIKGIAEQTNLLALNAAIEAARAGEQGRGFAVVADEVRGLASRTQQSTTEIHDMIDRLQTGTKNAVEVMARSRSNAQITVAEATKAGDSLTSINSAISEITSLNAQIEDAIGQQTEAANEINRSVTTICEAAQETAKTTEEMRGVSDEMGQSATQTRKLIGIFKL